MIMTFHDEVVNVFFSASSSSFFKPSTFALQTSLRIYKKNCADLPWLSVSILFVVLNGLVWYPCRGLYLLFLFLKIIVCTDVSREYHQRKKNQKDDVWFMAVHDHWFIFISFFVWWWEWFEWWYSTRREFMRSKNKKFSHFTPKKKHHITRIFPLVSYWVAIYFPLFAQAIKMEQFSFLLRISSF